jgi:acyl-CoA thioesterase-1
VHSLRDIWAGIGAFLILARLAVAVADAQPAQGPEERVPPAASAGKPERKTVVVLGDSLAAGYGLDPSEAFPALLQKKIDDLGWPFAVVNAGVSGDTTAGGLRRIDWLLRRRIDVLILELGGNDGLRGLLPEVTRSNLQAIIDRARKKHPQVQIIVAGMQMPPNMGAEYTNRFQRIFPELAKDNSAALIPFLLEGVGGKPELNLPDRIHPTAEGQRLVAENVWKVLEPVLEKTQSGK